MRRRRAGSPKNARTYAPCRRRPSPITRRSPASSDAGAPFRVGKRTYSVPSRLIGHTVEARQHPTTVEVRYRGQVLETMPRIRGDVEHRIDYRHIISALVRKPGAFARYRYREELFPTLTFRRAYDALVTTHGDRADVEYLRVLHLAAVSGESRVATTLDGLLADQRAFDYAAVQ